MITSAHIFYIPLMILAGFILGIVVGRRSAALERQEAERKARREAARKAAAEASASSSEAPPPHQSP